MMSGITPRVRFIAGVTVTSLCIFLALREVDVNEITIALGSVEPGFAVLAAALMLCNSFVTVARFRIVLGRFGFFPVWRQIYASFSVGLLGNHFVFNVIGQSIGRASILASSDVPFRATVTTTVVERVLAAGVLAAAGLAAAWLLLPFSVTDFMPHDTYLVYLAGGMASASLAAVAVSYRNGAVSRTVGAAIRSIKRFYPALLLTVLSHSFMAGAYVATLLALGFQGTDIETVGALLIVMFVSALPISLGGWGARELSAVTVLGAIGMEASTAFAAAILMGLLLLGVTLAISIPGLWLIRKRGPHTAPDEKRINPSSGWNERLVTGCGAVTAVAIFFQFRIQGGTNTITANVADIIVLLGLGTLVFLVAGSRVRQAALPRPFVGVLLAFSLLFGYGLLLGYANFGANSWALVNRGLGWVVILGYAATGLAVTLLDDKRASGLVLRLFVTAGTTVAALQLLLLFALQLGFVPPAEVFDFRIKGFSGNANAFAFQMTMTAIAAIVSHRLGVLGPDHRWLTAVLAMTGLAVFYSGSRAGIGMFAMLLVLYVAISLPPERRAALMTTLRATAGMTLAAAVITGMGKAAKLYLHTRTSMQPHIQTSVFRPPSDAERWGIFQDGWNLWLERPVFGHGVGAYVENQLAQYGRYEVFHSVPSWLMAEMGIIGLAVGLVSFGYLVSNARRLLRDPAHRAWGTGLLIVLLCWGTTNLLHDFFFQRTFWFFAALAFGQMRRTRSPANEPAGVRSTETGVGVDTPRRLMLVVTEDRYFWSHRVDLALAARNAGYRVTVATRVAEHGEKIRSLGLGLVHVDFSRWRFSPGTNLRTVRELHDIYRRYAPHLVHHVAIEPIVLGSVAAAWAGVPVVVNALAGLGTALTSDHPKARLVRPGLRPVLGWAMRRPRSSAMVQNPEDAKFLESIGVRRERISLVRGAGVDLGTFAFRPEPAGRIRVTMASRLLWEKGVCEFVKAAALVREKRKDVVFTLVGKPDEEHPGSVPPEQVRSWVADGLIEWWGYREDVAAVLAASHIAVLPTCYGEGVPKALLEAAACGRPIVATDVPGCREVVRDGADGLLVPTRDALALAEAIAALVDDPARRAAMGAEGRRRAEAEFAADRIHAETLQVYERALAAGRG